MSDSSSHHCPFLNRSDTRCAEHLNLDDLRHVLGMCFDRYTCCPVYLELLAERRVRQANGPLPVRRRMDIDAPATVHLTISARHALPRSDRQAVPALSGV